MTFSPRERQLLLKAHSIGPKMVDYIELAGIGSLDELARANARDLAFEINARLGTRTSMPWASLP